jgi:hypothetical protein
MTIIINQWNCSDARPRVVHCFKKRTLARENDQVLGLEVPKESLKKTPSLLFLFLPVTV